MIWKLPIDVKNVFIKQYLFDIFEYPKEIVNKVEGEGGSTNPPPPLHSCQFKGQVLLSVTELNVTTVGII